MSKTWWADNSDSDDEKDGEGGGTTLLPSQRDAVVFCIDCRPSMFRGGAESPFRSAVTCAARTLSNKIISSDTDLVGVLLYGTKKSKNENSFDGVYVLHDLDVPSAQRIKELEELAAAAPQDFPYGHADAGDDFPFHQSLWMATTMFQMSTVKVGFQRIWLFTDLDLPNASSPDAREMAITRAKDLADLSISIEVFPIAAHFDASKFYRALRNASEGRAPTDDGDDDGDEKERWLPRTSLEDLYHRVRRREFRRRALNRFALILGDNVHIGVAMYKLIQEAKKNSFVWLNTTDNTRLQSETTYICGATGRELDKFQMQTYHELGGKRVDFSQDDMAAIKRVGGPAEGDTRPAKVARTEPVSAKSEDLAELGIRVMGFKPRSRMKWHHQVRPAFFIYPAEDIISGSTVAFQALVTKMIELDQVGIGRAVPRRNAAPIFVYLVPQAHVVDDQGALVHPSGIHCIQMPYADDIRKLQLDPTPVADSALIEKAKAVVDKLDIPFDSNEFENPALQRHYAGLQALALNQQIPNDIEDTTLPDIDGMRSWGAVIDAWKEQGLPKPVPNATDKEWIDLCKSGEATKRKVDEIKTYLKSIGEPTTGRKAILLNFIRKYWDLPLGPE